MTRRRQFLLAGLGMALSFAVLLCLTAIASVPGPSWWISRGVVNTNVTANDYATVTQGQVKNIATQAAAELSTNLPGGAGSNVLALVNGFTTANNYLPANNGQLKSVAKPFYDRLITVGYTNAYPWAGAATTNDYAIANVGELKNLFSWDLKDSIGDGIADWWRAKYFGGSGTTTGNTSCASCDPDGDQVLNLQEYLTGTDPTNAASHPPPVATPTFTPDGGTFAVATNVTVSCATNAATIHYTVTGRDPTESDPVVTSGSNVFVNGTETLNAKAWKSGLQPSAIKSAAYAITGAIAAGSGFSLALDATGQVWAWGDNASGELGNGVGSSNNLTPLKIPGLTNVTALARLFGSRHAYAIKADGSVWGWGDNSYGQLGDGTTTNQNSPILTPGLTNVVAIAAGVRFSLALKTDGTVLAWGDNLFGQLGNGTTTNCYTPGQVTGLSNVTAIAVGFLHALAVKTNGTVWAWGENDAGQLGNGSMTDSSLPVQAVGITNATAISASRGSASTTWAVCGSVVWGWGGYHSTPTQAVCNSICLSNVAVIGNDDRTDYVVLTTDGTVWPLYPTPPFRVVGGLTNVISIAVGESFVLALKSDGTVWGWGSNGDFHSGTGELGLGDDIDRNFPIQIPGFTLAGVVPNTTSPPIATVGDGVTDPQDPYPPDPSPGSPPASNPSDHTPPVITLTEPTGATLLP